MKTLNHVFSRYSWINPRVVKYVTKYVKCRFIERNTLKNRYALDGHEIFTAF